MTSFTTLLTLDNLPIVLPEGSQNSSFAAKANTYWCPLGKAVGKAFVLMRKQDVDTIAAASQSFHTLKFVTRQASQADQTLSLSGLVWVNAQRVHAGDTNDDNALYLVELADRRTLVQQFSDTGKLAFNLRSFAQADDYLTETENVSWLSAITQIWNTMSFILGTFPGLPGTVTPNGLPENIHFSGKNSWNALHHLLEKINCTTAYDPVQDSFSIISLAASQSNLPADDPHLFDTMPVEHAASSIPETVRVYFHTHYRNYGQERDTQPDDNWLVEDHSYSIDVATNETEAVAGTVFALWDDLPHILDENNLIENSTELTARANARMQDWLAARQWESPRKQLFSRIIPDVGVGSEIKSITWRCRGFQHGGSTTEIVRSPTLPLVSQDSSNGSTSGNWDSPDLDRHSTPAFPRLINAVQAWDALLEVGDNIQPNVDGLIPGRVVRWVAGQLTTLEDCWIRPINLKQEENPSTTDIVNARHGDRFVARLSGIKTSVGKTWPIYLAQIGQPDPQIYWGTVNANVTAWAETGCTTVSVTRAIDCATPDATGATRTVVLPEIADTLPNLHAGDIIAFARVVDSSDDAAGHVCVSDYTANGGGESVVVTLNGALSPWADTPGCQIVSGDIVACSGSGGEVGETIDVIFPNVPGKVPAVGSGDRVSASPSDITTTPKKYVVTSDYSKTDDPSVIASLNGELSPWPDTPGCQIVSGDIVACNGSGGEVSETIDIVFPNVPGKVPALSAGDYVAASPTDLTASPAKYVVSSDYSKVFSPGTRPFELTGGLGAGSGSCKFLDVAPNESGTVIDRFGLYDYGVAGDTGYAAWVIIAGQYEIIDFKCDDGLGGS